MKRCDGGGTKFPWERTGLETWGRRKGALENKKRMENHSVMAKPRSGLGRGWEKCKKVKIRGGNGKKIKNGTDQSPEKKKQHFFEEGFTTGDRRRGVMS